MRSWFHFLIFAVIASSFSVDLNAAEGIFGDEVERGDGYIDKLLKDMIDENGHEYDPYELEDSKVGFSKRIAFVNVSGEAKLHKGYITGLKSLHRPDHCSVEDKDGKLNVKAELGAGVLNFHYDGTVKFMNYGPTINVHGELAYLETRMVFTVDSKTGRDGKLKEFVIDDMKGMNMQITGLGPMNWALNYLANGITSLFKGFVKRMVENMVRKHLEERLPNYQFPVEGGDEPETEAPQTEAPETEAPETEAPETEAPETEAPETEAPETEAPETEAPEIVSDPEDPEVVEAMQGLRLLSYLDH